MTKAMSKAMGFHSDMPLQAYRNKARRPRNGLSNTKVPGIKKKRLKRKLSFIQFKSEALDGKVVIHLPLETVSEANNFDHWTKKHKRHNLQKRVVALALNPVLDKIILPCHIKVTRIAPRKLDRWDNLPMSVKYILDACCANITGDFRPGRADDDERITVSYDQTSSSDYGVIVEFSRPS